MSRLRVRNGWRRLRVALAVLTVTAVATLTIWPSAAALECEGVTLEDGCLFTITGGDTLQPDDGYAVTNANDVPLWDFVRQRDLQAIGYPISQRWMSGPFTLQAFQKVILQWDPGKYRMNYYNTLDVLANRYPEVELPNVPPHQVLEADRGADFATITRNHLALLEQNAAIKERFLSEPDWLNLYGLPISYEEREVNGNPRGLQMLRAQRTVFVIWNVSAPGTTVGRVNLQNVPDKVKKLSNVIIPDAAKAPLERGEAERFLAVLSDRAALVALYYATDGANWANNTNWLSDMPLTTWYGVSTSRSLVTELRLGENQLTGKLPPELSQLAYLRVLTLDQNQLQGEIPPGLGRLLNLESLSLSWNRLHGVIPPELGRLTYLTSLRLQGNQLTGEIPPELGHLAKLSDLALDYNELSGSVPAWLADLPNLYELSLDENLLTGTIPPELGRLANLRLLSLAKNHLSGEIPPELSQLSNLVSLRLFGNWLSGTIPLALAHLTNLYELSLNDNLLRGTIPSELGRLTNLGILSLGDNRLDGEIPPELGRLANLSALYLQGNQLSGGIPHELANTRLGDIRLHDNLLTGEIPPELGRLTNLQFLLLRNNRLSGSIPPELGHLANLRWLWLAGGNHFTGCIPGALQRVANNDLGALNLPFC